MKATLIKQFIRKALMKTIVFVIIMAVIVSIGQSISPVISNELALTQMENSNETYILMHTYNKIRPIVNVAYAGIVALFVYTICRDTYKFVNIINKNKKEN